MNKDMDKWLQDMRGRMDKYRQDPPEGLWEDLHARLEQEGWRPGGRRHAPVWGPWTRRLAVAACIAVALTLTWRYLPGTAPTDEPRSAALPSKSAMARTSTSSTAAAPDNHSQTLAQAGTIRQRTEQAGNNHSADSHAAAHATLSVTTQTAETQVTDGHAPALLGGTAQHEDAEQETTQVAIARAEGTDGEAQAGEAATPHVPQAVTLTAKGRSPVAQGTRQSRPRATSHKENRLSLAAYAAGSTASQVSASNANSATMEGLGADEAGWEDSPSLGMAVYNQGHATRRTVHHRLPVRVGLSVAYGLTDRLALGSGLTYTRLRSDLREGSGEHYMRGRQDLHYVGLPVTLRYTLLRVHGLDVYAQGGVQAEVRVAGKVATEYVLGGESMGDDKRRIESHPVQMSASVAAGVQYRLTPTLALYAEPGVSHYFGDGSQVPTIYKDRPTQFSLDVGLRFCVGK